MLVSAGFHISVGLIGKLTLGISVVDIFQGFRLVVLVTELVDLVSLSVIHYREERAGFNNLVLLKILVLGGG